MAVKPASSLPGSVLFACNYNRVRSPMAEALLKRLAGDRIYVDSCGLRLPPEGSDELMTGVDPFVEAVMAEIGCELSAHHPRIFEDLDVESFDLVISFTPEAQDKAVRMARGRAAETEYWPAQDPTVIEGSREARLQAYRDVRDALACRIAERFQP